MHCQIDLFIFTFNCLADKEPPCGNLNKAIIIIIIIIVIIIVITTV